MPKEEVGNKLLADFEGVLTSSRLLDFYLDAPSILAFSVTCQVARCISSDFRKQHALKSLLTAVAEGNEALAKKIVASRPELLLDASAIVTDLSGKEIKNLTPLQLAICAGDVDMMQMIKAVLQHKRQAGITLGFEPELAIHSQLTTIYPNGDIGKVEAAQMATAQEFKDSTLRDIFAAINTATVEQVKFELDNPGQHTGSDLNAALHNFRTQFAITANSEQIFNPFYLLKAFDFYDEQFNDFNGNENSEEQWDRRRLFWCQVIGYMQRHLPACYLQAFAQGIYYIIEKEEKLERDFEFRCDKGFYMRAVGGNLNNLGYKYAPARWAWRCMAWHVRFDLADLFSKFIANKKSGLENLRGQSHNGSSSRVTYRLA